MQHRHTPLLHEFGPRFYRYIARYEQLCSLSNLLLLPYYLSVVRASELNAFFKGLLLLLRVQYHFADIPVAANNHNLPLPRLVS
jgi:hypothetical protein